MCSFGSNIIWHLVNNRVSSMACTFSPLFVFPLGKTILIAWSFFHAQGLVRTLLIFIFSIYWYESLIVTHHFLLGFSPFSDLSSLPYFCLLCLYNKGIIRSKVYCIIWVKNALFHNLLILNLYSFSNYMIIFSPFLLSILFFLILSISWFLFLSYLSLVIRRS